MLGALLQGTREERPKSMLHSRRADGNTRQWDREESDALLFKSLRDVPFLFADEHPRRLCSARPPWGLLSHHPSQLGAPANWSQVRHANRTREHIRLCQKYAQRLQENGRLGRRPLQPKNESCAIVGSGGSLRGSGYGRLIDSHHAVMRFNAAPAGGEWSGDVGNRTTWRVFTDKTIFLSSRRQDSRSSGDGLLLYCMATWVGKCVHAGVRAPSDVSPKLWLVNPVFIRQVKELLDEHGGRGRCAPSRELRSLTSTRPALHALARGSSASPSLSPAARAFLSLASATPQTRHRSASVDTTGSALAINPSTLLGSR